MLRYFIPDKKIGIDQASPALWAELGLSHAATQWPALNVLQAEGPSGTLGTVVVFHGMDATAGRAEVGYYPDKQDWVKCGKYWCGRTKGEAITPEMLRRPDACGGYRVRLGDGNEWEIPEALYGGRSKLTRKIVLTDEGGVKTTDVVDRFRVLDEKARAFWMEWSAAIDADRNPDFLLSDLVDLSVYALQCNYGLDKFEACNVLGLLDEENVWQVCQATVSWPRLVEMAEARMDAEKKTE